MPTELAGFVNNHLDDDAAVGRKPLLWTVLGTVLGLTLLYVSTRQVDAAVLASILRATDPVPAVAVLLCVLGFVAVKTWRWALLLRFVPGLRFSELQSAIYAGLAVNFLIAHVGEFLRTAKVAKAGGVSASAVFATVVIERLLDFVAMLLLLVLVSMSEPSLPDFVRIAIPITGAIVVAAVAGLCAVLRTPAWLTTTLALIGRPLPQPARNWCSAQFAQLRIGMNAMTDVRTLGAAVAASVLQWALIAAAIACSAIATGTPVSAVSVAATFVLIIVGLSLPNSPMQIGTTQLAFTVGLGAGGAMATGAIAASLVYTLLVIVPIMAIGGFCLLQSRNAAATRPS